MKIFNLIQLLRLLNETHGNVEVLIVAPDGVTDITVLDTFRRMYPGTSSEFLALLLRPSEIPNLDDIQREARSVRRKQKETK